MIFVTNANGEAPIVHSFADENARNVTVNGTCYLDLLNEVVWPGSPFVHQQLKNNTGGAGGHIRTLHSRS